MTYIGRPVVVDTDRETVYGPFQTWNDAEWFSNTYFFFSSAIQMPEEEEFEPQEWKLLFKLLCENPAKLDFNQGLAPYGQTLLKSVQRKLGINVVGVDISNNIDNGAME